MVNIISQTVIVSVVAFTFVLQGITDTVVMSSALP